MRYQRARTLMVLLGLVVIGATLSAVASATDQGNKSHSQPAANRASAAEQRYEAALADREAEQQRIEQGRARYQEERSTSPIVPRDYLVSFEDAVPVESLFRQLEIADPNVVTPRNIHTWLAPPASTSPSTGQYAVADLGWPASTPAEIDGMLSEESLDYLRWKLDAIDSAIRNSESGSEEKQAAATQRGETQQLIQLVQRDGTRVYALHCLCSPDGLEELENGVPGLAIRVVELAEAAPGPIWPEDRLRDKIIQTEGRYGR